MTPQIRQESIENSSLRLETLIKIRWAAISGQLAAVAIVYFGLGYEFNFVWCVAVIALSIWLNIFLSVKFRANYRIRNMSAAYLLGYDIIQLSALLYLTGGLQNPFAIFLLAPTTIAAGSLFLPQVLALNCLTIFSASFLVFFHQPLPWVAGENIELSEIYIFGIWGALLVALAFFGAYAWRVAQERRHMNEALIASEMVLAREQKLSALDGMAAAMAHELGTPLSTISVAAKDLFKDKGKYADISDDIELIYSQALKCRDVLSEIGRGKVDHHILARMSLDMLLSELVQEHQKDGVQIKTHDRTPKGNDTEQELLIERNPAIIYGLGNIVSNAVRYSSDEVDISTVITETELRISVEDNGPGFDIELIEYLGEPVIPKLNSGKAKTINDSRTSDEGLGLGLFIAKTFLERSGAKIIFSNRMSPIKGARVEVIWEKGVISNPSE